MVIYVCKPGYLFEHFFLFHHYSYMHLAIYITQGNLCNFSIFASQSYYAQCSQCKNFSQIIFNPSQAVES